LFLPACSLCILGDNISAHDGGFDEVFCLQSIAIDNSAGSLTAAYSTKKKWNNLGTLSLTLKCLAAEF
jgi:hypothetical protein